MNLLSLIPIEEIEQFLDLVLLGNKTFFAVCFSSVMCFLLCVSHKTASAKVCVDDKTPQDGIVIACGMPCVSLTSLLHFYKKKENFYEKPYSGSAQPSHLFFPLLLLFSSSFPFFFHLISFGIHSLMEDPNKKGTQLFERFEGWFTQNLWEEGEGVNHRWVQVHHHRVFSVHLRTPGCKSCNEKKKIEMKKQRNFQQPATKTPSPLSTTPHRPERLRNRSGVIRHMQVKDVNRVHFQCLQRLPELRLNPGRCQPSRS